LFKHRYQFEQVCVRAADCIVGGKRKQESKGGWLKMNKQQREMRDETTKMMLTGRSIGKPSIDSPSR
jgi:hypothetical protein